MHADRPTLQPVKLKRSENEVLFNRFLQPDCFPEQHPGDARRTGPFIIKTEAKGGDKEELMEETE